MEWKEQGQKIGKKLISRWNIKLISVVIAFGLWFAVMYFDNPPGEETFTNIPVQFINTERLTDQNLVYEVLGGTDVVRQVTVRGPRKVLSEMKNAGEGAIVAIADFDEKNMSDVIAIQFKAVTEYASAITEIRPASGSTHLRLSVEEKAEKNVSVRVILEGVDAIAEEHQLGAYKAEQNLIRITGAKSKVDKVSYAAVTVDVTGSDSDISTTDTIRLYDSVGNLLESNLVQKNIGTTKIDVTILSTRTVPITYSVSGEVAEGYRMTGETTISKDTVKLAGPELLLNAVNSINIPAETLDVTGLTDDLNKTVSLRAYLPEGTQLALDEIDTSTTITVAIERLVERNYKMLAGNVKLVNVPEDVYVMPAPDYAVYDVGVRGLSDDLNSIRETALGGTVDIGAWIAEQETEQIVPGVYYIPGDIVLPDGTELIRSVDIMVTFLAEPMAEVEE